MNESQSYWTNPSLGFFDQKKSAEDQIASLLDENKKLHAMLEVASEETLKDKEKLEALNYFTSHKVRATVARIWGLTNVLTNATSLEEAKELTTFVQNEANLLNTIIYEANSQLNATKIRVSIEISVNH